MQLADNYTVEITANLPAKLLRFDLELLPGLFDYDTLYTEMVEFPGGEYAKTGPWDLAIDLPPGMARIVDDVASRQPHQYALALHAATIERVGEQTFACYADPAATLLEDPTRPRLPPHRCR
jgi:hypothetical protein